MMDTVGFEPGFADNGSAAQWQLIAVLILKRDLQQSAQDLKLPRPHREAGLGETSSLLLLGLTA